MMQKISLEQYKQTLTEKLKPRTLCFLISDDKVLLGKKLQGFGQGYWLGIGGKVEADETVEQAMIREGLEEISVSPTDYKQVATINFYFPYVENPQKWNQQIHVFLCTAWLGEPRETEEIHPEWFDKNKLPFAYMWADAYYWLSNILHGEKLTAEFLYDKDMGIANHTISQWSGNS
ncbi:MAG TPA: 8-oxo-dGTP diphosphatase [Patescibacteria group bacterium]|nr:8-oxo-dGTP diphosphatase [Patescibacteria group bacterium]